jgi:dipeptidyl aminopeptidase/acylaminoacyl peptidase
MQRRKFNSGFSVAVLLISTLMDSWVCATVTASIELGDIPGRPAAPQFPIDRFFQIQDISELEISPDNQTLYFLQNDRHVSNVFAIDLTTKGLRQVTTFSEPVAGFLVGRNHRFLIVIQDVGGHENFDIYRYSLKTGGVSRLTQTPLSDMSLPCDISSEGKYLFYMQSREGRVESDLWRMEIATGKASVVLPGAGRLLTCEQVSVDGRYLLFQDIHHNDEVRLGLLDLVTGAERYIERDRGVVNIDAGFAGDVVYYLNAKDANGFRLWAYKIGSRRPQPVNIIPQYDIESLRLFSGGRVAVMTYRTGMASRTEIFSDGFEAPKTFAIPSEDIVGAVFSRNDPQLGIIVTENAAMPRRFYLVKRKGVELLYDSNQSGIDDKYFATARSTILESFDGLGISVHFFIPNHTSEKLPRPAIVWIHGGPQEHIDPLFHNAIQFLANRGFIVVTPNVRGSTGFGKRYSLLDNGDWGGGHIKDIVEVANFVRSLRFVDGNRLFVLGESFGGFSVMSLITQYPKVFKAAINFFGITELSTFVDSLPPNEQKTVIAELGFDPRLNNAMNRAISPLYHLDRIKIPLQVHQGANDRRVPKAQSDRLVERMRQLGLAPEYYVYPDEGHGFRHIENELSAFTRVFEFLARQSQWKKK